MTTRRVDLSAAVTFFRTAFEADDWVALFLKSVDSGRTTHRVFSMSTVVHPRTQAWLRGENANGRSVYASVNTLLPNQYSRRRESVAAVRHVFLDIDAHFEDVLRAIHQRGDVPQPSFVLRTSRDRGQVLWRVSGFTIAIVEAVQKRLARELAADRAATSAAQMMRVPGFVNHKYVDRHRVSVTFLNARTRFTPSDFGITPLDVPARPRDVAIHGRTLDRDVIARARRYLRSVPSAVAGHGGDVQTFRVCCRLARGFALPDDEALDLLSEWNMRCEPPWSERELQAKLRNARQYGREPVGGLLEASP